MELINQFKKTLLENGDSASKVTVKNYTADVKRFISWFEETQDRPFPPPALPKELVEAYLEPIINSSPRSAKRYVSSLRKFFSYLLEEGKLSYNPLAAKEAKLTPPDPLHLKEFNNYLYTSNASPVTIKNYINDVAQFLNWVGKVSNAVDVFANINTFTLNEYKKRLIEEANLSPLSVNRKLSSLRKYLNWAHVRGIIKVSPEVESMSVNSNQAPASVPAVKYQAVFDPDLLEDLPAAGEPEQQPQKEYSSFGPFRQFQKSKNGLNFVFDSLVILSILKAIEAIKYNLWKSGGKQIFASLSDIAQAETGVTSSASSIAHIPKHFTLVDQFVTIGAKARFDRTARQASIGRIRSIPKSVYAPLKISTQALPFWEKMIFHIKNTRPNWYKRYHKYAFVHYLHFAVVLVFASFAGFKIYQAVNNPPPIRTVLASKVTPGRLISFRGRLNDSQDIPITRESIIKFAIYNSQTASGSALLWQENQTVKPDNAGNFTTTLGGIKQIDQDIFTNNPNLYLGISIGASPELAPRQELANVGLTKNTQELQGLKPITGNNAGTTNVILALDSSGNLTIGGNAAPVFQATGGEFTLSGQQLNLATNIGTNTNIVLKPDGTGIIDLQKPLQNTSNNNSIPSALGAVEIDDNLAILATSSAQSALAINQNGTGDLISAISQGTAKFSVDNRGSGSFAGDLSILSNNLTTVSGTFNIANTNSIKLNIGGAANSISIGSSTGTTTVNNNLKVNGILSLPALTPGSITFINGGNQIGQDNASLFWNQNNKRLGLGTSTPSYRLSAIDSLSQAGGAVAMFTNTSTTDSADTNVLRLNTGVATSGANSRFITFYAGCATENCQGSGVGNIHQVSGGIALQSGTADFAERFSVHEATEPGDVIGTDTVSNRKIRLGDRILGVVSDSAIVIGNSPDNIDKQSHPIVGLLGQIRTKVSTENGKIEKGDPLSASTIPGTVKKATENGEILGTALESYGGEGIGKILVLVRPSWNQSGINISETGSVDDPAEAKKTLANQQNINGNDPNFEEAVLSIQKFIDTLNDGLLEVGKISTNSLSVATEDVKIGGQTLRDYISSIVNEIVDRKIAENNKNRVAVVSPLAQVSIPASQNAKIEPSPSSLASPSATPTPDIPTASTSATYITNVYNNASPSASISPVPSASPAPSASPSPEAGLTPATQATASPSGTPTPEALGSSNSSPSAEVILNTKPNIQPANIATFSAELSYIPNLKSDFATFADGLIALGPTSLTETSINGELSIGHNLKIGENSINTIGSDLNLQPLRQGNLSIMGGLVAVDTQGNLSVNGNATFAKDVSVKGTLAAGIISPIADSDLIVKLGKKSQENQDSSLVIHDQNGKEVVKIDKSGSIVSSGSGAFANFKIIRGAQADTSFTETIASGSAGVAVITANESERTIITPFVNSDSLIYLTPVSDTQGQSPYIARQTNEDLNTKTRGSFTIQISKSVPSDIKLNWWIIN